MKSKRTPDRVHVVRPPENDGYRAPDNMQGKQNTQIVRVLAQVSDKLKRSEAERYELLAELRENRKSLRDLEDRADNSEKAYLSVENKIKSSGASNPESLQRQVRFERSLKETEDKMLKSIAGQAIIDKRLRDTEDKQTMIDQRLDQSVTEQAKLARKLEIIEQDKLRMMRKVERLEDIISETQDSLRAKAMGLLTDKSKQPSNLSAPSWDNIKAEKPALAQRDIQPERALPEAEINWSKYFNVQNLSVLAFVLAALILGWVLNQKLMTGTTDRVNVVENNNVPLSPPEIQKASATTNPTPNNVLDYSDEQLIEALEKNPDQLAGQLNNIEPGSTNASEQVNTPAISDPKITPEMENFEQIAFVQDPQIGRLVLAEKRTGSLAQYISTDLSLPPSIKSLQEQAFKGNAEAQHDLAAIYTAGHGGVEQNFDKAALWFREASEAGIANARYNLGVLYHQGLGKERDLARALYWYREAAKLNHAEAQYNLGIAHIEGIGTDYNPQLAAAYFERAANNGIMEAAYNLGLIHDNGLMGQSKADEALLWYKIAADQGSKEAQSALEQLAKNLQIGMDDIDNLVERMQIINESVKGRRAGPSKATKMDKAERLNSDSELVTQIQEYLMLTGAYEGPADGVNGDGTQNAIRSYQAVNDLPVDGQISEALLNSMVGGAIERLNNR